MKLPEELKQDQLLLWSPGRGTEVWAMLCACAAGDLETVKSLLDKDPTLARCSYCYRTPLYFAVRENRIAVVVHLFENGADPLGLAVNDSLIEIARDRGYAAMKALLERKIAGIHGASVAGEPVAAALRERDLVKLRALIEAEPALVRTGDRRGNQPIHWAVMTRHLAAIDELLNRGAEINARRCDGARPVQLINGDYHYRGWRDAPKETAATPAEVLAHLRSRGAYIDICTAAYDGDIARVRELLKQDSSLANRGSEYVTYYAGSGSPLRNAAGGGHLELVRLLLDHGADPNLREEQIAPHGHALYAAVYNKHFEVARLLLERGAHPNPEVESSADALSIALLNDDQKMVNLLCSYGASRKPGILAYYGDVRTAAAVFAANPALAEDVEALENAAGNGHEEFIRLLVRHAPDLPRQVAVGAKTRELTELLFHLGMDPNQTTWLGVARLHEFAGRGDLEKAAAFLDHGADVNLRDEDIRSTPLGWAAKFGKIEMVKMLFGRGASPNLPDDPPWATPLAWATRRGHTEVAEWLQLHGAT